MNSLPPAIRTTLETLPDEIIGHCVVVCDSKGIILHTSRNISLDTNAEHMKSLWGKCLLDFMDPPMGLKEELWDASRILRPGAYTINVSLSPDFLNSPNPDNIHMALRLKTPAILSIRNIDGFYLILIQAQHYYMDREKGRLTMDMVAIIDEKGKILQFCDAFLHFMKPVGREGGLHMHQLTDSSEWSRLLNRESEAVRYLDQVRESDTPWSLVSTLHPFRNADWVSDVHANWSITPDGLQNHRLFNPAFNTCLLPTPQLDQDIRITLTVSLKELHTIGVAFHVNIYYASTPEASPDIEGYTLSVRQTGDNPSEPFMLVLKKQARFLERRLFPVLDHIRQRGLDPDRLRVTFERSGGAFSFYLGDENMGTLYDTRPMRLPEHDYWGLLCSDGVTIRELTVFTRPSSFDSGRLPPDTVDIAFYRCPGEIFETRIGVQRTAGREVRYVYMKNVSYSRELLNRLNSNLNAIEDELDTAKKIQTVMSNIPIPQHPNLKFSYYHRSSRQVGGDLLDIKNLGGGRYAVLIYDVAGHGIAASLISSMAKMSFENAFRQTASPAEIMELVNRDICAVTGGAIFITAFLGIFDADKKELTFARAGHCLPAVFNRNRPELPLVLREGSAILGNSPDFEYAEFTFPFLDGDRILLYTDGLIEMRDKSDTFFGKERLFKTIENTLDKPVDDTRFDILKIAERFLQGAPFEDDLTFILVDVLRSQPAKA